MGRKIPRPVVRPGHALAHRTTEEIRTHGTQSSGVVAQLFPGAEGVLKRCDRGTQQQSQSHYEKSVRIPDVQSDGTRALSRTWQTTRANTRPHILLTNRFFQRRLSANMRNRGCRPAAEVGGHDLAARNRTLTFRAVEVAGRQRVRERCADSLLCRVARRKVGYSRGKPI